MASLTAPADTLTDAEVLQSLLALEVSDLEAKEVKGALSPHLEMGKDRSVHRERGLSVSGLQTEPRPTIAQQSVSDSLGKLRSVDVGQNSKRKSLFGGVLLSQSLGRRKDQRNSMFSLSDRKTFDESVLKPDGIAYATGKSVTNGVGNVEEEEPAANEDREEERISIASKEEETKFFYYLSKVAELHKNGLLSEHQRRKIKEGLLVGSEQMQKIVLSKYAVLKSYQELTTNALLVSGEKAGYLHKKPQSSSVDKASFFKKPWKRRYFVLKPKTSQLVYFESQEASEIDPESMEYEALGEIDLTNGGRAAQIITFVDHPRSCKIVGEVNTMEIRAADEMEMDDWITAFAEARVAKHMEDEKAKRKEMSTLDRSHSSSELLASKPLSGILVKRGDRNRAWKARYFVVTDSEIRYYNDERDEKPLGSIPFESLESEEMIGTSCIKRFTFKVQSPRRTFYLMARDNAERKHWMSILTEKLKTFHQMNKLANETIDQLSKSSSTVHGARELLKDETRKAKKIFARRATAMVKSGGLGGSIRANSEHLGSFLGPVYVPVRKLAKNTHIITKENIVNYEVWNHREEIGYLPDPNIFLNTDRDRDGWFQFEIFIQCVDIVVSDEFYESTLPKGLGLMKAVKGICKRGNQDTHAVLSSRHDRDQIFPYDDDIMGPPPLASQKNSELCTFVVVYLSRPTVESKDFLRQESYKPDFEMHRIGRTEIRTGSSDAFFSTAVLLSFPSHAGVVEPHLIWSTVDFDDAVSGEDENGGLQALNAIVRLEVYVKVNEQNSYLYGRSDYFLSDLLAGLRNGETVDSMVSIPSDVSATNNIMICERGSKPRTSIRAFWPKFYSSLLPSPRATMAQTFRFQLPKNSQSSVDICFAREELVEASLTYDIPTAWLTLRVAEWAEEHRKLQQKIGEDNQNVMKEKSKTRDLSSSPKDNTLDLNNHEWQLDLLQEQTTILDSYQKLRDIYRVFGEVINGCSARGWVQLSFKSSKKKKHASFAFVATNLHTQLLTLSSKPHEGGAAAAGSACESENSYTYDFITTGAPAAHNLGYENGGLCRARDNLEEMIMSLEITVGNNLVERGRSHSAVTSDADAVKEALELEDIMNLLMEDSESSKHFFQGEMTKRISTQSHAVKHREDHVMSQVLSGLAESFLIKIYLYAKNKDGVDWRWSHMFEIFSECGYLYELESLLSTRGNEQGMLEDAFGGIRSLKFCQLSLAEDTSFGIAVSDPVAVVTLDPDRSQKGDIDNVKINDMRYLEFCTRHARSGSIQITRLSAADLENPGGLLLTLFLPPQIFEKMPPKVRHGERWAVVPLMFTQGINEQQSMEIKMGKKRNLELQTKINLSSHRVLKMYFKSFVALAGRININSKDIGRARNMLNQLEYQINTANLRAKSCQVLMTSANVVRFLGGSRATCCKSAKDRTSMSVTHEQARIALGLDSQQAHTILGIANVMREFGVRIGNARKNVGKKRFAFNSLQRGFLPPEYQPPRSVAGQEVS